MLAAIQSKKIHPYWSHAALEHSLLLVFCFLTTLIFHHPLRPFSLELASIPADVEALFNWHNFVVLESLLDFNYPTSVQGNIGPTDLFKSPFFSIFSLNTLLLLVTQEPIYTARLSVFFTIFLTSYFFGLLLRSLKVSWFSVSVFTVVIVSFSFWQARVGTGHLNIILGMKFLPLLMLVTFNHLQKRAWSKVFILAFLLWLQFCEMGTYISLASVIYLAFVFFSAAAFKQKAKLCADYLIVILGFGMLILPSILFYLDVLSDTVRSYSAESIASLAVVGPVQLFGMWTKIMMRDVHDFWFEYSYRIGLITLGLALMSPLIAFREVGTLKKSRSRRVDIFCLLTLPAVSLAILSILPSFSFFAKAWSELPILSSIQAPVRLVAIVSILLIAEAALVLERLRFQKRRVVRYLSTALAAICLAEVIYSSVLNSSDYRIYDVDQSKLTSKKQLGDELPGLFSGRYFTIFSPYFLSVPYYNAVNGLNTYSGMDTMYDKYLVGFLDTQNFSFALGKSTANNGSFIGLKYAVVAPAETYPKGWIELRSRYPNNLAILKNSKSKPVSWSSVEGVYLVDRCNGVKAQKMEFFGSLLKEEGIANLSRPNIVTTKNMSEKDELLDVLSPQHLLTYCSTNSEEDIKALSGEIQKRLKADQGAYNLLTLGSFRNGDFRVVPRSTNKLQFIHISYPFSDNIVAHQDGNRLATHRSWLMGIGLLLPSNAPSTPITLSIEWPIITRILVLYQIIAGVLSFFAMFVLLLKRGSEVGKSVSRLN